MKKTNVVVSGIVLIGLAVTAGYLLRKDRVVVKTTGVSHEGGIEVLKAAQLNAGMALKTHLDSPVGKAWKAKDFAQLRAMFGLNKNVQDNISFFQASIYILDVTKPEWKPEEKQSLQGLQDAIAEYMIGKREKPVLGPEAQALSYASKVLLKFSSLPEETIKSLSHFYGVATAEGQRNQKDIVGETLLRLNPLPEKGRKIIRDKITSKQDPYQGVVLIAQMRDAKAAAELWNEVAKNFKSYPQQYRAMIFKQLVIRHQLIKEDLSGHLESLAKNSDDNENAEDAFLVGVRELNFVDKYRSDVQRIANQSRYPETKSMALSLLTISGGAK
ncbi:hypothetical protein DOM22_16300 [Bdellovibrio sp. ZAP7]|uniref:hypothetical protein n=1 Tax=Bdellovibrio sp. ZAP7 TaxID=2231053 RepID=UPI00115BFDFB|nr:hypothetical protein [Bdellovibrio sp. ZAP7]QDK46608.1 hypothetical protein DOM22_16300 [Bdellovibrio sp. ZAP7]